MSQVGVWNGVDTGAARVETEERKSQTQTICETLNVTMS
jgi:hypothetical protein